MSRVLELDATRVVALYDAWTAQWHIIAHDWSAADTVGDVPLLLNDLRQLHAANFALWHLEDRARDMHASDSDVAQAKRAIDAMNQKRNDWIERCDERLLQALAEHNLPNPQAEPHSETPGLILDRLSILSLKHYHTREELERAQAPPGHTERNRERLGILELQRTQLAASLDRLWRRILQGERNFRVYRQLKMYNDPDLNPVLYRSTSS